MFVGAEEAAQAGLVSRLVPEDMVDAEVGIKLKADLFSFSVDLFCRSDINFSITNKNLNISC